MEIERYKICIFGNSYVGRTSLIQCFAEITNNEINHSIGEYFYKLKLNLDDFAIELLLVDLPTYKLFPILYQSYFKGAQGGIFVFDITNIETIECFQLWINRFRESNEDKNNEIPILMIGNKIDKRNERKILKDDAISIARKYHILEYFECSAKTGMNVEKAFMKLVKEIL